jgi:nucleoside 2-deoxyribosyltransferase
MNSEMRCFVAMAVGRADTDRIYDKYILPTLRAAGIRSIFMGRLEHNDDIDKRIIQEIEACDLCIADLTYARPSVYFEAGFAQRKVPVIYTSREDHLRPRANDEFGNYRVHFDLLMRNIVSWSNPQDRRFARKLARRIRIVVAPLLRQRHSDALTRSEEARFQSRSLESRFDTISKIFIKAVKGWGYVPLVEDDEWRPWVGRLPSRGALNACVLYIRDSFSQKNISDCKDYTISMLRSRFESVDDDEGYNRQRWQNQWGGCKLPKAEETRHVRTINAKLVLCSLQKIPRGRLASALPSYTANETSDVLVWSGSVMPTLRTYDRSKPLPISLSVCVCDGIKSAPIAVEKSRDLKRKS